MSNPEQLPDQDLAGLESSEIAYIQALTDVPLPAIHAEAAAQLQAAARAYLYALLRICPGGADVGLATQATRVSLLVAIASLTRK